MSDVSAPEVALSTIEWAKLHGEEFRVRIVLDNYEPTRAATALTGYRYAHPGRGGLAYLAVVLVVGEELVEPTHSIYLLDSGTRVEPYYVVGWPGDSDVPVPARREDEPFFVILHPFPLSLGTRPDNGQPIDMSGWALGPRKAYHCKVVG